MESPFKNYTGGAFTHYSNFSTCFSFPGQATLLKRTHLSFPNNFWKSWVTDFMAIFTLKIQSSNDYLISKQLETQRENGFHSPG